MYGGLEYVSALRARYFAERGDEVWLLCSVGSRVAWALRWNLPPDNLRFIEEPSEDGFLKHREILDEVDLIIDDSWTGRVAEAYPKKSVKVWHGPAPPHMFRLKERVRHFGVSKAHADLIRRLIGVEAGYIYNAVDASEYPFNSSEREDFVLYMNRIDREKGAHVFVELCRDLGIRGVIIGEDLLVADQAYVHELLRGLPPNVDYLGRVPHQVKVRLLQRAACLVAPLSPLYFEVFGLYVIEAGLCGCPVVAFRNGALPELIKEGVNGYLADSYEDLARLTKRTLEKPPSPAECRRMAVRFDHREVWRRPWPG
jgi:glycosyltransferase involved in cell wall biosynthesis